MGARGEVCGLIHISYMDVKVYVPNLVTHFNHIPIFVWHVVRYGSENRHHKDICFKEIKLSAQNMIIILDPMVNTMEETYIGTEPRGAQPP